MTPRRAAAALLLLAAGLPALAYVLPPSAILRHLAQRRAALSLASLEVTGTLEAEGPAAERLGGGGGRFTSPARFLMRVPGRCRLELSPPGTADAARAFVAVRDGKVTGRGGLEQVPAAVALVRDACALLAVTAGETSGPYAASLGRRGVALTDASLGRFDGRLAYVLGGRARDARALAFVDKETFQPVRLVAADGADVRLLGWGSPAGGDAFPRAIEVLERDALRLRFGTGRVAANPRLADTLF